MIAVISLDDRPPSRMRWLDGFRSGYYRFLRERHPDWPAMRALEEAYGTKHSVAKIVSRVGGDRYR